MYGILASIWVILWVQVRKYTIHLRMTTATRQQHLCEKNVWQSEGCTVEKQCSVEVLEVVEVVRFQSHHETSDQLAQEGHILRHLIAEWRLGLVALGRDFPNVNTDDNPLVPLR